MQILDVFFTTMLAKLFYQPLYLLLYSMPFIPTPYIATPDPTFHLREALAMSPVTQYFPVERIHGRVAGQVGFRTRYVSHEEDVFTSGTGLSGSRGAVVWDGGNTTVLFRVARPLVVDGVVQGCANVNGIGPGAGARLRR